MKDKMMRHSRIYRSKFDAQSLHLSVLLLLTIFLLSCLLIPNTLVQLVVGNQMYGDTCNESVCGSIVSKCLLTQSCKCDQKSNVTCFKDCFYCLDLLYNECCSCVEMCPKPNLTDISLSSSSHVEELPEASSELFQVLTEEQDRLKRWVSFTFPVQFRFQSTSKTQSSSNLDDDDHQHHATFHESQPQVNCTVAYMSQCMSWNKCRSSCLSMGATSYRWFHDGCCECVGINCINYGLNEPKCMHCPFKDGSLSDNRSNSDESNDLQIDQTSTIQTDTSALPISS